MEKPAFFFNQSGQFLLSPRRNPARKHKYTAIRFHPGILPDDRLSARVRKKPMHEIPNRIRGKRTCCFRDESAAEASLNSAPLNTSGTTWLFLINRKRTAKDTAHARNPTMTRTGRVDWQNNCQEHQPNTLRISLYPGKGSSQRVLKTHREGSAARMTINIV